MVDTPELSGFSAPAPPDAAPRKLCTDCGLSRTRLAKECGHACQFLNPDYTAQEARLFGRARDPKRNDERFFGPYQAMYRARMARPSAAAQWTGITTQLGAALLRTGTVDAVLTTGPDPSDRWKPQPILVTTSDAMAQARGMRMGFGPLLSLLEPAAAAGHKRIAVIGIPCQVHALRRVEAKLGFDRIYVIGTPCSDNTTTENFHAFLARLSKNPDTISYLEFRADYRVELRFDDGRKELIPFLKLPIADLPDDFFPLTCRTCVDYTNTLADITVGYMGGSGEQWVIVRSDRGAQMLDALGDTVVLSAPESRGNRAGPVKGFMTNTERAAGGLPLRRMPDFMRGIMGWLMPKIGPKGLEFARARVEMKAIETVLYLRQKAPRRLKSMVPDHVWPLVEPYGLTPTEAERLRDIHRTSAPEHAERADQSELTTT